MSESFWRTSSLSSFFQNSKNLNLEFWTNSKKYQNVVYDLFYLCVNLYHKITYILFSAKITKIQSWEHIFRSGNMFQNLSNFSFLLTLLYKKFHNKNLHDHSVRSWLHSHIFFRIFWNFKMPISKNNKKRAPWCLGVKPIFCHYSLLYQFVPAI
jgi:hypothetical protein